MKVAILGRTEVLLNTAKLLYVNDFDISLIITAPAAPEYSVKEYDFEIFAKSIGAEFLCTNKINDHVDFLSQLNIDIGVSMNYTSTIDQHIIDCFKLGILNAHLGDLPRYRGNATPNWAIINGETNIPMCIQYMIGGELDSGDILNKKYKQILTSTKIGEIYSWVNIVTPGMYLDTLNNLIDNPGYVLEKQSKVISDSIRCYPRIPEDSKINWMCSNLEILRLVNASSTPFTGAYTFYADKTIIIDDCELYEDNERYYAMPGQVCKIDKEQGYVLVITGSGKLKINSIVCDGVNSKPADLIRSIRTRLM